LTHRRVRLLKKRLGISIDALPRLFGKVGNAIAAICKGGKYADHAPRVDDPQRLRVGAAETQAACYGLATNPKPVF
jgi:hypothetical protein